MQRFLPLIPIAIFAALVGFLAYRLDLISQGNAPDRIPSVMIGKPAPDFDVPQLAILGKSNNPRLRTADLKKNIVIVNFFSSWCVPCQAEHSLLEQIHTAGIVLIGINYKDKPANAAAWLKKEGDPYDAIGSDLDGRTAIDFGVYGVPESYLIDKQGIIRFKQTGPLTSEDIRDRILPLARELNK